jgi:hypothetical protein
MNRSGVVPCKHSYLHFVPLLQVNAGGNGMGQADQFSDGAAVGDTSAHDQLGRFTVGNTEYGFGAVVGGGPVRTALHL